MGSRGSAGSATAQPLFKLNGGPAPLEHILNVVGLKLSGEPLWARPISTADR